MPFRFPWMGLARDPGRISGIPSACAALSRWKGVPRFYFVTDGLESALKKAKDAAKDQDVRIGGGVSTIRQYLTAGRIDEIHLVLSPVVLGEEENLFSGIHLPKLGFKPIKTIPSEKATHVIL